MTDVNQTEFAKAALRKALRAARRDYAAALDPLTAALVLRRPPSPIAALVPAGATIGVYAAAPGEAPALGYARHFHESGHTVALPWFADRASPMAFRRWASPWVDDLLVPGPWGPQPAGDEPLVEPDVVFVPLVGFAADGSRLGQGGGHYDRWLAAHPDALSVGLAWDCQKVDHLPREPHDRALHAIVTPTTIHGPFA